MESAQFCVGLHYINYAVNQIRFCRPIYLLVSVRFQEGGQLCDMTAILSELASIQNLSNTFHVIEGIGSFVSLALRVSALFAGNRRKSNVLSSGSWVRSSDTEWLSISGI